MATKEQTLRTRWVKTMIDGEDDVDPMCRLCGVMWETVTHLIGGCGEFAKKQYTRIHKNIGKRVHWELCKKHGVRANDVTMFPVMYVLLRMVTLRYTGIEKWLQQTRCCND